MQPGGIPTVLPDDIAYKMIFLSSAVVMFLGVLVSLLLTNRKAHGEGEK
jgi:hypothetical protein